MTTENKENLAARIYGIKPNFTTQHQTRFIYILPCLKIHLGFLFVLVLPLSALIALFFIKRNRPDNYLINLLRYYMLPGHYQAIAKARTEKELLKAIIKQGDINDKN